VQDVLDDSLMQAEGRERVALGYAYETIKLSMVRNRIHDHTVAPPAPVSVSSDTPEPAWLRTELQGAFEHALRGVRVAILSVDDGTGSDKFVVPVHPHPVSGAWIHAAIALSALASDTGEPVPFELRHAKRMNDLRHAFWKHLWAEIIVGVAFVLAMAVLLPVASGLSTARWPTFRLCAIVLLPLVVAVAIVFLKIELGILDKFLQGSWVNPLPMLVGMTLHLYVDLAAHGAGHAGHGAHHPPQLLDHWFRRVLQVTWAFLVLASLLMVLWPLPDDGTRPLDQQLPFLMALALAVAYVGFATSSARQLGAWPKRLLLPLR
jgi:hypothetical protein